MAMVPTPSLFATALLMKFQERVKAELSASETIHNYTPHGLSHIQGVEASIDYLRTFIPPEHALSAFEKTILRFCAWSHDLGMIRTIAIAYQQTVEKAEQYTPEKLRKDHDKASAYFLQTAIPELLKQLHGELNGGAAGRTSEMVRKSMLEDLREAGEEAAEGHLDFFANYDNLQRQGSNAVSLANTIALVARYHRRAENMGDAPLLRHFLDEPVRVQFLAALFRLADALHVDRTRFEQTGYDMLAESPQFTEESRVHWIKSFIVSSIRFNEASHTVHVQADIPVASDPAALQFGVESDRLRSMLSYIVNDLTEDVLSVSRILLKRGLPPLLGVTHEVHEIPAMLYPQDVRAALNHLFATSSPNTSRLVGIALDVLRWHLADATKHRASSRELAKKIDSQVSSLNEQLVSRPCHEALWKVHDLLKAVMRVYQQVEESANPQNNQPKYHVLVEDSGVWRTLYALLDGVQVTFDEQRLRVKKAVDNDAVLKVFDGCSDVILYGYSDQALLLLTKLNDRAEVPPAVHVLECRTKTTYAPAGDLIYLDGDCYARALLKEIRYRGIVTLEPDAALARILYNVPEEKRAVVLLGTNAIYPDGTFVHSMGHLTVVSTAKAPHLAGRCRVVVVTDGMKIGYHSGRNRKSVERHPDTWLTHRKEVVAALKDVGAVLHNWHEDTVPIDLIDHLIVLDVAKVCQQPFASLITDRFDAPYPYCGTLAARLLASYLDHAKNYRPFFVTEEIMKQGTKENGEIDVNLGNWRVAEAYVGNLALSERVREWIANAWFNRANAEIELLKEEITAAYFRLVGERPRDEAPRREPRPKPAMAEDRSRIHITDGGTGSGGVPAPPPQESAEAPAAQGAVGNQFPPRA